MVAPLPPKAALAKPVPRHVGAFGEDGVDRSLQIADSLAVNNAHFQNAALPAFVQITRASRPISRGLNVCKSSTPSIGSVTGDGLKGESGILGRGVRFRRASAGADDDFSREPP